MTFTDETPVRVDGAGATHTLAIDFVDGCGSPGTAADLAWTSSNSAAVSVSTDGLVTANSAGLVTVSASHGSATATTEVVVLELRNGGAFERLGFSAYNGTRLTDLWIANDRLLTGTGFLGSISCPGDPECEHAVLLWDLTDPEQPIIQDSLVLPGPLVNDVKITPDGILGLATITGSANGGVVLLDLSSPGSLSAHWPASGKPVDVEITLEADSDDKTVVTIVESPFPLDASGVRRALGQTQGWTDFLCSMKAWQVHGVHIRQGRTSDNQIVEDAPPRLTRP